MKMMAKPQILKSEISFTAKENAPILSKSIPVIICPKTSIKNIFVRPIFGAKKAAAKTIKAPKTPPKYFHHS